MKKLLIVSLGLVALLGLAGCGKDKLTDNKEINSQFDGAPSWVTESSSDLLSAVGSAKIKNNNLNFATTQAGAAARAELATQISTKVEGKYKELATSTEVSVNQEAVQALRIGVSQTLAGSKITNKWITKDGTTLYVLVKVEKLNTELLKNNFMNAQGVDKAAAAALSKAVDEIIDGPSSNSSAN